MKTIKIIQKQHRKNHGKMIKGELHLKEGICYTPVPLRDINHDSLFIHTINTNKYNG